MQNSLRQTTAGIQLQGNTFGIAMLGADNVWCASTCGHEKPDRYSEYLKKIHAEWKQRSGT